MVTLWNFILVYSWELLLLCIIQLFIVKSVKKKQLRNDLLYYCKMKCFHRYCLTRTKLRHEYCPLRKECNYNTMMSNCPMTEWMNTSFVFLSIVFINIKISSHNNIKGLWPCCFLALCFSIKNDRFWWWDSCSLSFKSILCKKKQTNEKAFDHSYYAD